MCMVNRLTGGRHTHSDSNPDSDLLNWVTEIWTGTGGATPGIHGSSEDPYMHISPVYTTDSTVAMNVALGGTQWAGVDSPVVYLHCTIIFAATAVV